MGKGNRTDIQLRRARENKAFEAVHPTTAPGCVVHKYQRFRKIST